MPLYTSIKVAVGQRQQRQKDGAYPKKVLFTELEDALIVAGTERFLPGTAVAAVSWHRPVLHQIQRCERLRALLGLALRGGFAAGQFEAIQVDLWDYADEAGVKHAGFSRNARSTGDIKDRLVYMRRCLRRNALPAHLVSKEAQLAAYFAADDARVKVRGQGARAANALAEVQSDSDAAPAHADEDADVVGGAEAEAAAPPGAAAAGAGDTGAAGGDDVESAISRASSTTASASAPVLHVGSLSTQQTVGVGSKRARAQVAAARQALPRAAAAAAVHARAAGR